MRRADPPSRRKQKARGFRPQCHLGDHNISRALLFRCVARNSGGGDRSIGQEIRYRLHLHLLRVEKGSEEGQGSTGTLICGIFWRCAVILAVCSCFGRAHAASQAQWKACHEDAPPDDAIVACSYILGGSDETPRDLAVAYMIRGRAHEAKGGLDPALADYSEALRKDKSYARPYQLRGRLYSGLLDYNSAIEDFAEANRLESHNLEISRDLVEAHISRAALNPFGPEGQIRDYTEAIRLDPANVRAYLGRASAYAAPLYDQFDRALADYAKAIALDSKNVKAFIGRGEVYWAKQDYDRAFAALNKALSIDPNSADAHQSRAEVFLSKKDFDRAFADFNEAIRLDSKSFSRYSARAQAYSQKGDLDRAISDYSEAIALNRVERDGLQNKNAVARGLATALFTHHLAVRAELYELKGEMQKAIADYTEALSIDPSRYFDKRADAYVKMKQYDLAIEDYTKSIDTDADEHVRKFWKRGKAYLAKKEAMRAVEDFSEAIHREPKFASAYAERARAFLNLKDYPAAIADYSKLISFNPKNSDNYRLRAAAEKRAKLADSAIADYSRAIRLRPPDADDTSDLMDRGFLYEQSGDLNRAIADYSEAIRLAPDDDIALFFRGRAHSKKGDLDHAEADFNDSFRVLITEDSKKGGPSTDPRADWKPKSSLSYELKRAVTSVFSGRRTAGRSPIEDLVREPCVSNAASYLATFKSNLLAFNAALAAAVDAIARAQPALEQFGESVLDKKTICGADRVTLDRRERDVREVLKKLKSDIATAALEIEAVSDSIHEDLIDKLAKDSSPKQDSKCPSKEKYVSQIRSEISNGALGRVFDAADEPDRTIMVYTAVYASKETSIGDARNALSYLRSRLDEALTRQQTKVARMEDAFQACRR